jgi:hypothetical protein
MATLSIKPVSRETSAYVREKGMRPIVVTIHHGTLELRPKGLRNRETVDIASLYYSAVKSRVWRERMDKAKSRAAKKKARKL